MFRASTVEERSHVLIVIDGELSCEYVDFIDRSCEQASAGGKPVHVLLRDVSLIDAAGRQLLSRLAANGVSLRANGIYNRHLISECRPELPRGNGHRRLAVTSDPA